MNLPAQPTPASRALRSRFRDYGGSFAVVAVCTAVAWELGRGENLPATLMVFLLGVVGVAWRFGHGASLLACILSLLSFDYFFETPAFTLAVANWTNLLIFSVMLAIAQLVAELVERLQQQVRAATRQARETDALYHLSLALSEATTKAEVESEAAAQLEAASRENLPSESPGLYKAFQIQIAQAEARVDLAEQARAALLEAERERTRSALLSAVSHDLRTPLTAIQGAASSLLLKGEARPDSAEGDLLSMIVDESERLTRLVTNLIEMTRLESGDVRINREWQPLEEIIGAALARLEARLGPLPVRVGPLDAIPLVNIDGVLMEQLFINLMENALRHAPGTMVEISAASQGRILAIEVSDRGPGISEDQRERIFEKFARISSKGDGGAGLGLAICRAVAKAHGGSIHVVPRQGGGASFCVRLPLEGDSPQAPLEEESP